MAIEMTIARGTWWRFERYEVSDSYIRPAAGAKLQTYDPWAEYKAVLGRPDPTNTKGAARVYETPYASLLSAVRDLRIVQRPDGFWHCEDHEQEEQLLAWVNRYGLLGILPHIAESAILAPRKRYGKNGVTIASVRYDRSYDGSWVATPALLPADQLSYSGRSKADLTAWDAAPKGAILPAWLQERVEETHRQEFQPRALLRSMQAKARAWPTADRLDPLVEEPLTETWGHFFPAVAKDEQNSYSYPLPLSEQFWSAYGEPLLLFYRWVLALEVALEELNQGDLSSLAALTAPLTPAAVATANGSLSKAWLAPSLLSSLAMMALLDATEGRHSHVCEGCGRLFVSAAHQARYCSQKCRFKVQKRRQRAHKQAQKLNAMGTPLAAISELLGYDPETVRSWITEPTDSEEAEQQ